MSYHIGRSLAVVCAIALAGCAATREPSHLPLAKVPLSFTHAPYIHPKIIEDLTTALSDLGDQVVAINLTDSQNSNRYFGDILVTGKADQAPYVFFREKTDDSIRPVEFGYQYIGTTKSGIHVLRTSDCGGGTGVFENLLLVTLDRETGISDDLDRTPEVQLTDRIVIRKVGEIGLGDRWAGELRVECNRIIIGKDEGEHKFETYRARVLSLDPQFLIKEREPSNPRANTNKRQ